MPHFEPPVSHRFVVLYRREPREINGASEQWRGWVSRVQSAREQAAGVEEQRVWFQELSELPAVMEKLIRDADAPAHIGNARKGK